MSMYGDSGPSYAKESLYYEMEDILTNGGTLSDVLEVFTDFMQHKLDSYRDTVKQELECEYAEYKEKCKAMEKILGK